MNPRTPNSSAEAPNKFQQTVKNHSSINLLLGNSESDASEEHSSDEFVFEDISGSDEDFISPAKLTPPAHALRNPGDKPSVSNDANLCGTLLMLFSAALSAAVY